VDVRVHMDGGKKPPKPIPVVLSTGAKEPVHVWSSPLLADTIGQLVEYTSFSFSDEAAHVQGRIAVNIMLPC